MVERSRFWDGTVLGDATVAPYDAATEFSEVMLAIAGDYPDANKGGVLGLLSLAVTSPSANTVRVAAGQALVWGTWYENTANLDFTIPTPAGSTRIDRIVLRKSWAAQTVRLVRIAGAEGGSAPAMTQTAGTTWDIPIITVSITTGGTMTITDVRTQNTLWYRIPTGIRTDSYLVGIATSPPVWHPDSVVIHLGGTGVWNAHRTANQISLRNNSYTDTAALNRAIIAGTGQQYHQDASGAHYFYSAPSVAAGAVQTFVQRVMIGTTGTLIINPDVNAQGIQIASVNTNNLVPAIYIGRAVPSTNNQWIQFQGGAAIGDFYIGRRANEDDFVLAFWNGVSLNDRFRVAAADGKWSVTAYPVTGTASAGGNGAPPATVAGYMPITINGVQNKIPYYLP